MIDLSIIIVTYNSQDYISDLLDSIKASPDKLKKEIIIIDNASQDKSVGAVKNHPLKPILTENNINMGFSKAVNMGLKKAKGKFVLLLNPDTKLVSNCLQTLYEFAQKTKPLGAVAPRLLEPNGKPQPSVYKFPTIWNAIKKDFFFCKKCFGKYLPDNKTQKIDVTVMAAFLIPASVIKKTGLLSEKFFMYYEDVEYCRRLKKHKLPVYYLPAAKVKHQHGASGNFVFHLKSPLLASSKIYYGKFYSKVLNLVLWIGHKWQVILRGKKFRD